MKKFVSVCIALLIAVGAFAQEHSYCYEMVGLPYTYELEHISKSGRIHLVSREIVGFEFNKPVRHEIYITLRNTEDLTGVMNVYYTNSFRGEFNGWSNSLYYINPEDSFIEVTGMGMLLYLSGNVVYNGQTVGEFVLRSH